MATESTSEWRRGAEQVMAASWVPLVPAGDPCLLILGDNGDRTQVSWVPIACHTPHGVSTQHPLEILGP